MSTDNRRKRSGFNAIELVVVVVLVFIVMGLVVVGIKNFQENQRRIHIAAGRTQTNNNVKQVTLACHSFHDVYKKLPPAFDKAGPMDFPASVHIHLLPFLEQDNLYKVYLDQKGNAEIVSTAVVAPFLCPADITSANNPAGIQNFAANLRVFSDKGMATKFDANMPGLGGIEACQGTFRGSITDGISNTIFFTLKYANCQNGGSRFVAAPNSPFAAFFGQNAALVKADPSDPSATFQAQPSADQCVITPLMAQSMSEWGLQVGLGDGHVRMVSPDLGPRTWNLLVQPNDGMELGDDWQN